MNDGALDELDGRQVADGHRPDRAGRATARSRRGAAGDLDAAVAGRRRADAARQRHVLGHEARRGRRRRPAASRAAPGGEQRRGQAVAGAAAQRRRRLGRAAVEVDGDQPLAGPQLRVRRRRAGSRGALARAGVSTPVRRAGGLEQHEAGAGRRSPAAAAAARSASPVGHAGDRQAERVGEALRGREPDPQAR